MRLKNLSTFYVGEINQASQVKWALQVLSLISLPLRPLTLCTSTPSLHILWKQISACTVSPTMEGSTDPSVQGAAGPVQQVDQGDVPEVDGGLSTLTRLHSAHPRRWQKRNDLVCSKRSLWPFFVLFSPGRFKPPVSVLHRTN